MVTVQLFLTITTETKSLLSSKEVDLPAVPSVGDGLALSEELFDEIFTVTSRLFTANYHKCLVTAQRKITSDSVLDRMRSSGWVIEDVESEQVSRRQ